MNTLLIGNAIALLGSLVMIGIGFIKEKDKVLLAQCVQCILMGIGNLVLGGVTGFFTNIITVIRNIVSIKHPFDTKLKVIFIVIQVIPAIYINHQGIIGWLPIAAACLFTWFMDTKDNALFKEVIVVTQILWLIYDIAISNYVAFVFDILTIGSNFITFIRLKKEKH